MGAAPAGPASRSRKTRSRRGGHADVVPGAQTQGAEVRHVQLRLERLAVPLQEPELEARHRPDDADGGDPGQRAGTVRRARRALERLVANPNDPWFEPIG